MASISTSSKTGCRIIPFFVGSGATRRRRVVRLGKVSMKVAEEVRVRIEHLVAAATHNVAIDRETATWLSAISDVLYTRISNTGVVPARRTASPTSAAMLGPFIDEYAAGRTDTSDGTRANYETVRGRMVAFFGEQRQLASITDGDADNFKVHLHGMYAKATVAKTIKVARQFFAAAVRHRILTTNPFAGVKAPSMVNEARAFFVTRAATTAVLDACPDAEWRLLFALSRFGGLRCPSEHFGLKWNDVNWARSRFRVHAPKNKHNDDGGNRWVPMFPELRPYLEAAFEAAPDRSTFVIQRWRDSAINLRTQMMRIIHQAGLSPWPRLFQNLRASRETELTNEYPLHVVCRWLGNSPRVAADHYLQVTDDHFEMAATGTTGTPGQVAQKATHQGAANHHHHDAK